MNKIEALDRIKAILGFSIEEPTLETAVEATETTEAFEEEEVVNEVEIAMAEMEDENGVILVVEEPIEAGKEVHIKVEEGHMVAPDNTYVLTNGYELVVEGGLVVEYKEISEEEVEVVEAPEAEEAALEEEVVEETIREEMSSEELVELVTRVIKQVQEDMSAVVADVKAEVEELKSDYEGFKKQPAGEKITNNIIKKQSKDELFAKLRQLKK